MINSTINVNTENNYKCKFMTNGLILWTNDPKTNTDI